ncbi:MAG: hypothetical protein KKA84_12185 [Bacteroidetes bacterium]|nr:hypothetical protein [Bacteroidota bacterium]
MLKIITYLSVVLFFVACYTQRKQTENNNLERNKLKKWTYLFYSAADNKNIYDPLNDFSDRVSSNDDINYLVLSDTKEAGGAYYFIDQRSNPIKLLDLGETNMGDSTTLIKFINYSNEHYPAEKIIVAFYNHGGGYKGTCWDSSQEGDNLTLREIEVALLSSNKIELVMFTAPCYMGSMEAIYQLKDCSKYFIGSEDISGFVHWRGMLSYFDKYIKSNIDTDGQELCTEIISLHKEYINEQYGDKLTLCSVNLERVQEFNNSFNKVLEHYINNPNRLNNFDTKKIKIFGNTYTDLYSFLIALGDQETNVAQKQLVELTKNCFSNMMNSNFAGKNMHNYNGVNICFPNYYHYYDPYSGTSSIGLRFHTESMWSKFLRVLYK